MTNRELARRPNTLNKIPNKERKSINALKCSMPGQSKYFTTAALNKGQLESLLKFHAITIFR